MSHSKKKGTFWVIFAIVLIALFALSFAVRCSETNKDTPATDSTCPSTPSDDDVLSGVDENPRVVISSKIEWAQDRYTLTLLSGEVVTSCEVDSIFVNANGVGVQELEYTKEQINCAYVYTLKPTSDICGTAFGSDTTVTADVYVYVKSKGRSYKADTQEVAIKSQWTGTY